MSLIGKEALNRRKYKNSLNAKHFINFDFHQEVIYSLNIKAAKTWTNTAVIKVEYI